MPRYDRPNWFVRRVVNPAIEFAAGRLGLDLGGAWVLTVPGRRTGTPRSVPVNPLEVDGARYLVAPRGETEWVRNLRAARAAELRKGRQVERIRAMEVDDLEKPPILRAYLQRWYGATKDQWGGVGPDADEADLNRIAPDHPVFLITPG